MTHLLVRQIEDATVLHVIPARCLVSVVGGAKKATVKSRIMYRDEHYGNEFERIVVHMGSKEQCSDLMGVMIQRGEAATPDPSHLLPALLGKRTRAPSKALSGFLTNDDYDEEMPLRRIKVEKKTPPKEKKKQQKGGDASGDMMDLMNPPLRKNRKNDASGDLMDPMDSPFRKNRKSAGGERKAAIPAMFKRVAPTSPSSRQSPVHSTHSMSPVPTRMVNQSPRPSTTSAISGNGLILAAIAKLADTVEEQGAQLNYLVQHTVARPYPQYCGPQYLPKEAVARYSADQASDIVFFRQMVDAVSLPADQGKRVDKRDKMRMLYVKEQVRLLRSPSNETHLSKWHYLCNKYNHLMVRRAKDPKPMTRPTIGGEHCDDDAEGED